MACHVGFVQRSLFTLLLGSTAAGAFAIPGQAAPAAPAPQSVASFEEIVVTSRRRAERLQDIPDAVTAFTAQAIEDAGINTVADVTNLMPNLSIVETQQPGVEFLVIRGIGQARNQEPPIAMVVDGVQMSSSYQLTQELFDIERIEVLKGPQGALYGRNAIGGAINIVTRKPTNDLEGKLVAGYGNGDFFELKGVVSGPIIEDKLFFRVAGTYEDFDGLIHNVTLDQKADWREQKTVRAELMARPTEDLSIDLRASLQWLDAGAAYFTWAEHANDFTTPVMTDYPGRAERDLQEYSVKIDYDFSGVTLTSVTAFAKTESFLEEDLEYTPAPIITAEQALDFKSWSQEVRLTSASDGAFRWMVGAYYLDVSRDIGTDVFVDFANYVGFLTNRAMGVNPPYAGLNPVGNFAPLSSTFAMDDDKSWSGFGQINYDITDRLELTLALRYDMNEKRQAGVEGRDFDLWQPKASLAWKVTDDAMLYATAARGFRSGGFNPTATFGRVFDSEKTTNFEVGFKSSWADNRLMLNGAGFYTKYDDRQEYILIAQEGTQALINIPKSRILGFELEAAARPVEGLELQAAFGYIDSSIREFDSARFGLPGGDFDGKQLPFVYGWNYVLSAQYSLPVFADFDLVTRVDYSGKGDMYWHIDNLDKQKPVHLVNARIALDSERYQLMLYAENLFKEKYVNEFVATQWSGGLSDFKFPSSPRRYGIRGTLRF